MQIMLRYAEDKTWTTDLGDEVPHAAGAGRNETTHGDSVERELKVFYGSKGEKYMGEGTRKGARDTHMPSREPAFAKGGATDLLQ
jgi:hypothetical protein